MYSWLERVMPRGSLGNIVSRNAPKLPDHWAARWSLLNVTSDLRKFACRSAIPALTSFTIGPPLDDADASGSPGNPCIQTPPE
jgi:hypothetical protein